MSKQEKNTTMQEFIESGVKQGTVAPESPVERERDARQMLEAQAGDGVSFDFTEKFYEKTQRYNEEIWPVLDDDYTSITPAMGILVRAKCKELKEDGVIIPNTELLGIPTNNGIGEVARLESPYVFSKECVIVATPEHMAELYPVGTIISVVMRGRQSIRGNKDAFFIDVAGAYWHPKYTGNEVPKDPLDPHYGYFIIDPLRGELEAVLRKVEG